MLNLRNKIAAGTVAALAAPLAMAQTAVPDASTYVTSITTGQTAYSVVMFALALAGVGIMVGVKWIKRGKGAA